MRSSSVIILISDVSTTDRQLRVAVERAAPGFSFGVVRSREELQTLQTPSLIVLDLMLSHERPFDLLRWLRSQQRFDQTPVFALSSDVLRHDIDEAYALGVNSCLLNATTPEVLDQIALGIVGYAGLVKTSAYT
jgi:CheY-like chemotaxis protein